MYVKKTTHPKTGRVQLTIVQGYRDENGKVKQKTIKNLGYLDVLATQYPDPLAYFQKVAQEMTLTQKKSCSSGYAYDAPGCYYVFTQQWGKVFRRLSHS